MKLTKRIINDAMFADDVTISKGIATVRNEFFYTHGKTEKDLVAQVLEAFPNVEIVESGTVRKSFRGEASTRNSSHWFVKFTVN